MEISTGKITEFAVPFSEFGLKQGYHVEFAIYMYPIVLEEDTEHRGEMPIERCPRKGKISLEVPGPTFEMDNWFV